MGRAQRDVTEAELAVLLVLWDSGPATVRSLAEAIYGPGGGPSRHATVQKLLERLEAKGCVRRLRAAAPGGAHLFAAILDRDELIGRRLRAVADTLCDGSLTPLLTHLVRNDHLSHEERQALRRLIDDLDRGR